MTTSEEQRKEKEARCRHELQEALHYFAVAKMAIFKTTPDLVTAKTIFENGEVKLKEVIESLSDGTD